MKYRTQIRQNFAICAPSYNFVGLYLRNWGMYRQSVKKTYIMKQQYLLHTWPHNMMNLTSGWDRCLHLCASVTKRYNLVPAKGRWCSVAGEVTAGLAQSNGSLQPGGWPTVTCRLTACTPGSAPGPTLGIEYGKPLPFTYSVDCMHEHNIQHEA